MEPGKHILVREDLKKRDREYWKVARVSISGANTTILILKHREHRREPSPSKSLGMVEEHTYPKL